MARISVANLVSVLKDGESNKTVTVGFLNRKSLLRGDPTYTALGGAALLTDAAMQKLADGYSAQFENGNDARFLVADNQVESVLTWLEKRDSGVIELDLDREMREELCGTELLGQTAPILTPSDLDLASYEFSRSLRQTSNEPGASYTTHRLFFYYVMRVPSSVFAKLTSSLYTKVLTKAEIKKGRASDGKKVGGNIQV